MRKLRNNMSDEDDNTPEDAQAFRAGPPTKAVDASGGEEVTFERVLKEITSSSEKGIVVESIDQAGELIEETCAFLMNETYGWNKKFLSYHNNAHPKFVARRSAEIDVRIAEHAPWALLDMTQEAWHEAVERGEESALTQKIHEMLVYQKVIGFGHDLIQEATIKKDVRVRNRGISSYQNEGKTAEVLYHLMDLFEYADGRKVFADISPERVRDDVITTYVVMKPAEIAGMNTVVLEQPENKASTSLQGKVLGLCDLRAAYVLPSETARIWGDMEFLELNTDVMTKLREAIGDADIFDDSMSNLEKITTNIVRYVEELGPGSTAFLISKIEDWHANQAAFFLAQKQQTLIIINSVEDPTVRQILLEEFTLTDPANSMFNKNAVEMIRAAGSMRKTDSVGQGLSYDQIHELSRKVLSEQLLQFARGIQIVLAQ